MPTSAPPLSRCGTFYPIWLNGNLPTTVGSTTNMQVCTVGLLGFCETERTIKIHRCADLSYRYFLLPTISCEEAYCFGEGTLDTPPDFIPSTPTVQWKFVNQTAVTDPNTVFETYLFECLFSTDPINDLFYKVVWYFDDNEVKREYVKKDNLIDSALEEKDFPAIGVSIKCSVRPKNVPDGTPGAFAVSTSAFYGLELLNTEVSFPKSGVGIIKARLTIPFGCVYNKINQPKCTLSIGMLRKDANEEGCKESGDLVGQERFCVTSIDRADWSNIHELKVIWMDGSDYRLKQTDFLLDIKCSRTITHDVWNRHTTLPTIQIKVHEDFVQVKNKRCEIVNDPHMRTFDKRYFEHHETGVFTLYKGISNPTYEVQHQTAACNGGYHCTCGVAVRSGADVFVVDFCEYRRIISFITCHEKILEVRKQSAWSYLVVLPSGTSVEINIGVWLTAFINPSIHDWQNSRGLCGYISDRCDDDFITPDGNPSNDVGINQPCHASRFEPKNFVKSWQITKKKDNLFELQGNAEIPPATITQAYCTCPHTSNPDYTDFECGSSATINCDVELEYDKVGKDQCNRMAGIRRRKRSLEFPVKSVEARVRNKREVDAMQTVRMTPDEATTFCTNLFHSSPVFYECADIPEVDDAEYIAICALDIEITNTLLFSNQTLEDFKSSCMKELRMNNTLKEPGPDGSPSIASILNEKICPGNPPCSNNGKCMNGSCRCFDGYVSPDCSVDLTSPPELLGVRGDGLCDEREIVCNMSFVIVTEVYETDQLSCRISEFQISTNGMYFDIQHQVAKAKHETLVEVICPLNITTRAKRSTLSSLSDEEHFATGYNISISYDGVEFSDAVEMFVYDSMCQEVDNSTGRIYFTLKDEFCKIHSKCVSHGEYSVTDPCSRCDTTISKYTWSTDFGKNGCKQIFPEKNNTLTIVLATCIPVALITVAVLILLRLKSQKLKRSKVSASQDFKHIIFVKQKLHNNVLGSK